MEEENTIDYASFFTDVENNRKLSVLLELYDNFKTDDTFIKLAGGSRNPETFPITNIQITLKDGTKIPLDGEDMKVALQYGFTQGNEELLAFAQKLTKRMHDPPSMRMPNNPNAHDVIITAGAQDAIYKLMTGMLTKGDTLLTEENIYPGVFATVNPLGVDLHGIKADSEGILPDHLRTYLSKHWTKPIDGKPSQGRLKFLYCVPNGDNPTGAKYTLKRKQQIYKLAHEYNFLIIEDDAYYFLEDQPFVPSFLSLDVDGRVLRIDTFSKTLGPGFRVGYICAPAPVVNRMRLVSQVSSQGASHLSQVVLMKLVGEWGVDGYLEHCGKVAEFYRSRRTACEQLVRKYLTDMAEWASPSGGMFMWVKFPDVDDTEKFANTLIYKHHILMVAGAAFKTVDGVTSQEMRISYSIASNESIEKAFSLIAQEIRAIREQKQKTRET